MRIISILVFGCATLAVRGWALAPDELMCELLAKPGLVAVTDATPEFSWGFKDGCPGDFQTAYQVQVATSTEPFKTGSPDLWDSGRVASDRSLYVAYGGKPLTPGGKAFWRARVWDCGKRVGDWSLVCAFALADTLGQDTALRYPQTQKQVKPVRLVTNGVGRVFIDFGKAAFGWVELLPPRNSGRGPFLLHLGEKADGDSVDTNPGGSIRYAKVRGALTNLGIYRVPLSADARNTGGAAVPLPKELGVVMPFRYVEVEECPYPVTADSIRQIAVSYPFDEAASSFACSDESLARVFEFCKYSVKATSFAGVYVDGDRERIPYEADAYINQLSHYCTDREFTLARYSHEYLMQHPTWPTEWKQHSVMMAWTDWMYTGNTESLERCYAALKKQKLLAFCAREKDGLLVTGGADAPMASGLRDITDWPAGERDGFVFKPVSAVANAFYCLNLRQMAEIANALSNRADAVEFQAKAVQAVQAYNALFYDSVRGRYVDGEGTAHTSLHANMLPLAFGLVPAAERGRVAEFVRSRGMSCSVYGAQYLLEALFEAGLDDEALSLMTRDDTRSWLNMLRSGSTITMEAWDARLKPNLDWNHAWGAVPANIVPRYVLGVRPLLPGFKKILIRPQAGFLREVSGVVPTVRGAVSVAVRQKPGQSFSLSFDIPVNTTARVELPQAPKGASVRVDGKRAPAVTKAGCLVLDNLASGHHTVAWQAEGEGATCGANSGSAGQGTSDGGWLAWLPFF